MDYIFYFNVFEATLWTAIGMIAGVLSVRQPQRRWPLLIIAVLFFAFAASEVVETQTGAWWKPWWLAIWKGACITSLIVLGRWQILWARQNQSEPEDPEQS